MKKAEDYLIEEIEKLSELDQPWYEDYIYDGNSLAIINALKQAQIDAIEETCRVCAEEARLGNTENEIYNVLEVSKQSILSVADKLKKELE